MFAFFCFFFNFIWGQKKEGFEVQKYTAQKREGSPKREKITLRMKIEIITIENHGKQG